MIFLLIYFHKIVIYYGICISLLPFCSVSSFSQNVYLHLLITSLNSTDVIHILKSEINIADPYTSI